MYFKDNNFFQLVTFTQLRQVKDPFHFARFFLLNFYTLIILSILTLASFILTFFISLENFFPQEKTRCNRGISF